MAVLAGFGYLVAIDGLVTDGDALRTTQEIAASLGTFQAGVICRALVAALDVVVAWALARFLAPVHRRVALLAGWLRVIYAGVFAVDIAHLVRIVALIRHNPPPGAHPSRFPST